MAATTSLTVRLGPDTPVGEQLCSVIAEQSDFLTKQADANDRHGRFATESVARLTDAGVLAACAPVADGGFGLTSLRDLAVVASRLAECDASVATALYMHLALSWYYGRSVRSEPLERHGDSRQRQWNRAIGRREMIVCSSVAERGVTPWNVATIAVRTNTGWVINGHKILASISPSATHFYTRVRAETEDGPMQGSVMIPLDTRGVEVRDNWDGFGLRGSGSGEVVFSDVALPADAISMRGQWGRRGDGSELESRVASTISLLGVSLGIAESARTISLASLVDKRGMARRQRADSVGVRTMLADLEVRMAAARGTLHTVLVDVDARVTNTAPRSLPAKTARELMRECVTAGIVVERAAIEVVDLAMQICGGSSYVAGHPLGRLCRDVRAAMFMRPYAPAEEWPDFLSSAVIDEARANLESLTCNDLLTS